MGSSHTENMNPGMSAKWTSGRRRHRGMMGVSLFINLFLLLQVIAGQEVLAQQQSFRRRPEDVEIKLGDTAILRCEIENQAGQAQWTKDGFALGFARDIPNFLRYTMTGDSERGVHNLRIEHVALMDIAEYQCQVGPARANKPIRSDAKLNVIVPPVSVEITDHAPDAQITLKEKVQTELECVAKEARPAATIVWYRNDVILRAESRSDSTEETEVIDGSVHVRKNTTRSKIKFFPKSEDDKAKYTCEARHPAFSKSQKVSVLLSVQHAPGAPRIDGYNEDAPIKENKTVTLTCVSRGGNPLAQLIWYKNGVMADTSYELFGKESRNEYTFVANKKDDMATLRCEASNTMSLTPKLADVVLSVYYPPKEVKMTGPNEAKINDTITLTCASSNSNPAVEIALFKGGVALNNVHTSTTASPDGGFITSSNVTVKIDKDDRKVTFTCQAVNRGYGDTKSIPHIVNVIQPPGQPYIYKGVQNITAGQMHRFTCTSTGGHPPATLTWYKDGKKVDSTLTSDGNIVSAELSIEVNMTDNGIPYKCEAKNKAITTPLSETVKFQVFFPASGMTIQSRPKKLKEGEKAYLICESGSSNPPSRVAFWKNGQEIPMQKEPLIKNGEYGGKKTRIELELNLTASMDQAIYECEVRNSAIKRGKRESIKLDVNYKPIFTESGVEKVTVVEGEGKVISIGAKGNPNVIKYKWSKNGSQVQSVAKKLQVDAAILNFTEVRRTDKGKYECEASNGEGSTVQTIELEVQYPAAILTEEPWVMVDQGEDAHLECGIDANPLDESMVEWKYEEMNATRTMQRAFQDNKAYLTIPNASKTDAKLYWCSVNNGIGQSVNKSIFLIVKHKPDIDLSPQIAKAASNKGETGRLTCRARGAPNVTFSWNREGGSITPNSLPGKYAIQNRSIDLMTWESILEIKNVQTDDYGQYECIATNLIDFATHHVQLDVTSPPDTPLGLHLVNFTQDSVTLTWIPGFDGGFEQSFIIKYINMRTNEKRTVETSPPNTTVFTVQQLATGTEYSFRIMAVNVMGESNYTTEIVRGSTLSGGVELLTVNPAGDFPNNPISRLILILFTVLGVVTLLLNVLLIACYMQRRSKKRLASASEQGSSKSATIEMYAPSSYNETVTGETLSSISEKSASYSHGENHCDEYIDDHGKGTGVSTYLVEQVNHHAPGYPYGELSGLRASTLPRQPKHISAIDPHRHHEDDGYVDAMRRNAYNQGFSDKIPNYGRTTPRLISTRPPQIPPIPELYNIPPEARYVPYPPTSFGSPVGNGTIRQMPHSASHDMLNQSTNQIIDHMSSFHQPNGRLITSNGPLSPHRGSILTTFVPNPSPNNIEHEGHLV